jgi:hypothetical protein
MIDNEKIYDYIEYIIEALTHGTHEVTYFDVNESVIYSQYDGVSNEDNFSLTIELKRLPEKKKVNKIEYEVGVKLDNSSVKDTLDALAQTMAASRYEGPSGPHREY